MPWGKGTVVRSAKGFVFLGGMTGWIDGYNPKSPGFHKTPTVAEGAAAQTRLVMEKIKAALEEMGSSLENIVKMTYYIKGPFPDGVGRSPNWRLDVIDEFFREHCPRLCSNDNPPPSELIGVASLAHPDMVIEVVCIAALPD
ncbi:MAG TPA: RidA family protein [Dehalococcoidales bacterium]|nr:RidA family protein [Dehalococcoidales bacterium]